MTRLLALLLTAMLLSGCSLRNPFVTKADTVVLDRQSFVTAVGELQVMYAFVVPLVVEWCREGELTMAQCARAVQINEQLKPVWVRLEAIKDNPEVELDWGAIMKALSLLAGMAP